MAKLFHNIADHAVVKCLCALLENVAEDSCHSAIRNVNDVAPRPVLPVGQPLVGDRILAG